MSEKKKKKDKEEKIEVVEEKINIRCRNCFMVDGYTKQEHQCKHCGTKIYIIDSV